MFALKVPRNLARRCARLHASVLLAALAVVGCEPQRATSPPSPGGEASLVSSAVLVGAGDIADCSNGNDEATAKLLDQVSGTVFTAGDNAYDDGTASDFANCYEPTWGRHKARTRPSPGNHDYHTSGASAYYAYFGANAGPAGRGYYSYDLGDWHLISLNSNISMSAGSAQEQWLRADLAANPRQCTLAYWHHPRFSSGTHGSSTASRPLWQALYDAGADIVVVGHDHNYQRFAPQTPDGARDDARGIRQFVAGMGGRSHYTFSSPIANTEAYNTSTYGVLKLTLFADSYTWEFIPVAGGTYTDAGSATCVGGAPAPVASVNVTPSSVSIETGETVQLTATPRDGNGNPLTGRLITWASSNTAVATVNSSGLVTGVAPGSATITATSEGQSGTSAVTVVPGSPVASVDVTPPSASIPVAQSVQLTATPQDASGNPLSRRAVTWASSNTAVATVNGTGLVTGVAPGSATITATSEGKSGTSVVTVTPVPVTLNVTEGWDSKNQKTLVNDGKLSFVTRSDNTWVEVEANQFLSLQFRGLSVDETIQEAKLFIEHHEDDTFTPGSLALQAGGGALTNPFVALDLAPAVRLGAMSEGTIAWDVTGWARNAPRVNDFKLVVRNLDPSGKKGKIDRAYLVVTSGPPPSPPPPVQVRLYPTDGWDEKNQRTLVQDGKLSMVVGSDDQWGEVEAGFRVSYQFQGIPSSGVVSETKLFVEHHEEQGISANPVRWQAGGGALTNPTALAGISPAVLLDKAYEATVEWDASSSINTASQVNDLKLTVHNNATNGKKTFGDRVYVVVTYREP